MPQDIRPNVRKQKQQKKPRTIKDKPSSVHPIIRFIRVNKTIKGSENISEQQLNTKQTSACGT